MTRAGFGKTYSVLDFMVDNYDAPEFKDKKIFFVTTLKKNLPDKELREHFARRGKADDYDKYCLRIEANADMVVQKLDELYRARKIPPTITMKQEFKDLHGSVKLLNEYRDKKRLQKWTLRVGKWTLKAQKWTFEINYFLSQIRFQKKQ